jgi:hypothetical protein
MGISQEYRAKLKRLRNLAHTAERAPTGTREEFLAACGATGLGERIARTWCPASHVLGGVGDGRHRGHRPVGWHRCLTEIAIAV